MAPNDGDSNESSPQHTIYEHALGRQQRDRNQRHNIGAIRTNNQNFGASSDESLSHTSQEDNEVALGVGSTNAIAQINRAVDPTRYPLADIDDNDDVVSMSDSAANRRFADIGTIQSANTRRIV
jgi:hypothetical protein